MKLAKHGYLRDLNVTISTHLCKYCVYKDDACDESVIAFGTAKDKEASMPPISACSLYAPTLVGRIEDFEASKALSK